MASLEPPQGEVLPVSVMRHCGHRPTEESMGIADGLSIRVSRTLYSFGCLMLPALIAKNLSRKVRHRAEDAQRAWISTACT